LVSLTLQQKEACPVDIKNSPHILGLIPKCCIASNFLPVLEGTCIKYVSVLDLKI
jgi:hypothetical protein